MPRLPGHRYLGPGNPVRSGTPVDEDDRIAEIHDLAYQIQPQDVSHADSAAVDSFIEDWQKNKNIHSLIGGIGIQAKRSIEGVVGQRYPMPNVNHGGKSDYQYATKRLSQIYREQKKTNPNINWREFQKLHFGELMREARGKRGLDGAGTSGSSEKDPKRSKDDGGGPSTSSQRDHDNPFGSHWDDEEADNMLRNLGDHPGVTTGGTDVDSMETLANPSKGGGTSGHSHRGSGQSMIVNIPRTPKTPYYTKTYRKSWIFFSYGFTNSRITLNNNYYYTTPLMLIPVDLLALYMDRTEFGLLHGRAIAVHAGATVRPLGCRMNFQTSATESKWATSEFVAIGQSAIGLNLAMPAENLTYTPTAANPMIPSAINPISTTDLHEKLYGDDQGRGAISLVPRHLNIYFSPAVALPLAGGVVRFTHNNGPPKIDEYVDRYLVNTCIGEPIINYSYKPKNGIITDTYSADYINRQNWFRTCSKGEQVTSVPWRTQQNVLVEGVVTQQEQNNDPNDIEDWQTSYAANLYQTLEHYSTYTWQKGHVHGNVQPQVHVGLSAVPAINPGTEGVNFQNCSIYWAVETELTIHHYQNSCFHDGAVHTYTPNYYPPYYTKKYHSGNTYNHHPNLQDLQFQADNRQEALDELRGQEHLIDYVRETELPPDVNMDTRSVASERSVTGTTASSQAERFIAHSRKSAKF